MIARLTQRTARFQGPAVAAQRGCLVRVELPDEDPDTGSSPAIIEQVAGPIADFALDLVVGDSPIRRARPAAGERASLPSPHGFRGLAARK
jgi:hypothetical protein